MAQHRTTTVLGLAAAAVLTLTSCGGDNVEITEAETGGQPITPGEETTLDAPEPTEEPDEDEDEGGLPPGGTDRMADEDFDESIHGEHFELYFSGEGVEVGVAGIASDDAPLEVRAEPYSEAEVVAELDSLDAVLLGGRERSHTETEDEGIWTEVELADGYGWVPGHLYYFGSNEDVTEEQAELGSFDTPYDAAEAVFEMATESGDDNGRNWTLISSPEDFGEEFYRADVMGFMDDSVAGYRYFVYVEEVDGGYEVEQVETTLLCLRGVSDDGLCT